MNATSQLVLQLKQAGQDAEWYPTDPAMINAVLRWIPEDANSIMDIGAGDGRVLVRFAEKCKYATLYGIEISSILIQRQPDIIVPVGTDVFEQRLSSLPCDYIFSNPPYSMFEEWVCKVIDEGFAKKAFLVIPQRWKESHLIEQSLKRRSATARVIYSGDFLNAERSARAVIDIVEVTYPCKDYRRYDESGVLDPFDIWFDQNISTFDQAEEFKESETSSELARRFSDASIDDMVAAYMDEYSRLESNYRAVFQLDYAILKELGVDKKQVRDGLKQKMKGLKIKYWEVLFNRLDAITSRLSTKSKKALIDKLTRNTSVEFTTSNAYSIVLWAIKNANLYFDSQLIDLFYELSTFEGVTNYKSNVKTWVKDGWRNTNSGGKNTHYVLDYRIVVKQWKAIFNEEFGRYDYPGNLYKGCHELIADVIAVFSNLGFQTHSVSSYNRAWYSNHWEDFYLANSDEVLFQVKAFMNGNLHFRFNQKAIKALNITAGRLLKWVRTEEEVVSEMGYSAQEAKEYFHRNSHILPNNVKLLAG